jgi:hypothetical protein
MAETKVITVGTMLQKYERFLRPDFNAGREGDKAVDRLRGEGKRAPVSNPVAFFLDLDVSTTEEDRARIMRGALWELRGRKLPESTPIADSLAQEASKYAQGAFITEKNFDVDKKIVDALLADAKAAAQSTA